MYEQTCSWPSGRLTAELQNSNSVEALYTALSIGRGKDL